LFLAPSPLMVTAWLIVAGICAGGPISVNLYAVGRRCSRARAPPAAGSGSRIRWGNLAGIVGPIVSGLIIDRLGGFGWAFAVAAGCRSALAALWWWLMVPPIRHRWLNETEPMPARAVPLRPPPGWWRGRRDAMNRVRELAIVAGMRGLRWRWPDAPR
jgi:MFS family permease